MNWKSRIEHHYEHVWGVAPELCPFRKGPIHELPSDFSVVRFPPRTDRVLWTYATVCMSQPGDTLPIELHMFSQAQADEVVELLVVTAHYHRTGLPLGLGHTVNFGQPWSNKSCCDHGLISLPYLDGPALETLKAGFIDVKFYWLLPVTAAEVAFKKSKGLEALEELFQRSNFDYANPGRQSVVSE